MAYFYFISFHLIVTTIFLNLFIAVILNGFINSNEEESFEIIKGHIAKFKQLWQQYDHEATGFMDVNDLENLLLDLELKSDFLTSTLNGDAKFIRKFISHMQVPSYFTFQKYYF